MSITFSARRILFTASICASFLTGMCRAETVLSLTQTAYDANDRAVCTAVRLNLATTATDACTLGAEDTVNNWGPDRISRTLYDADGNVIEVKRAVGTAVEQLYATYTYTENGKKASEADANGNVTRLVYDGFDRLQYMYYPSPSVTHTAAPCGATAETWCGGTAPYTARVVNTVGKPPLGVASTTDYEMFGYNANGSKTSWRRRNGQTKYYGYDRLNRVVHENGSTGPNVYISYDLQSHVCDNIPGSDTASSGDDCTDRMTAVTTAGIHNRYDKAGRLLATKDANGRSLAYGYDEVGRRTSLTYPDSVIQGYQYNVDGSLKWSGVSGTTVGLTLAYDTRGRLTSLTRSNGVNSTIGYDDLSRPLSLKHTVTNAVYNADWAFVYNPASQVRKVTAPQTYDYLETAATVSTPTYDGLNRDTGIANQTTTCGNATDGYDCNGNLTYEGTGGRTFTYDIDNRLLTATGGSAALTLSYDAVGRLSSYTAGSTTTQFLYDGPNLIAEYQGGVLVKRYMHTTGVDQPFMEFTGTGTAAANANFPLANYQGSIIAVSDSTGNVSAANVYKYSPYGEPTNGADAVTWAGERFRYTGQIALPEARLYYYKARVYDPVYGRFLQTDPIGSEADLDLYAYVAGDPINNADPTGECEPFCGAILGAIIGGGIEAGLQYVEHGKITDGGAIVREAAIGAVAGATGAGAGAVVAKGAQLVRAARVGGYVAGAVEGAVSAGAQGAMKGQPADGEMTVGAIAGAASHGAGRAVSAVVAKGSNRAAAAGVNRAAARGSSSAKLQQSGTLTYQTATSSKGIPAAAGVLTSKTTDVATNTATTCATDNRCQK